MIPIRDSLRSTQTPYIVYSLIAVNILVFLYRFALSDDALALFTVQHGLIPMRYSNPAWAEQLGLSSTNYLPFGTNIFMHNKLFHLIPNMWILYIFGSTLEARMGRAPFFLFYLLCGVGANIVHTSFNPYLTFPAIGASGAVAGVIGGYAVVFTHARLVLFLPPLLFEAPAMAFAALWFIFQIIQGVLELANPSAGGGIAWWAHGGGFMMGMALAPFFPAHKIRSRPVPPPDRDDAASSPPQTSASAPVSGREPVGEKEVSG